MTNPLLQDQPLPPFSRIEAAHAEPAVSRLVHDNLAAIDRLLEEAADPDWDTLVFPLEQLEDRLNKAWSPVSHMNADSKALSVLIRSDRPASLKRSIMSALS